MHLYQCLAWSLAYQRCSVIVDWTSEPPNKTSTCLHLPFDDNTMAGAMSSTSFHLWRCQACSRYSINVCWWCIILWLSLVLSLSLTSSIAFHSFSFLNFCSFFHLPFPPPLIYVNFSPFAFSCVFLVLVLSYLPFQAYFGISPFVFCCPTVLDEAK